MSDYDVVVIGAGPAGYVCAIRAAQLGNKTAIIDKQWLGGVCLNVGCIPSKALLKNAEVAQILLKGSKEFGFSFQNLELDYSAAVKRSRQVSGRLTNGVSFLMRKNNIDVHIGKAQIKSRDTITVTGSDGEVKEIRSKNIVVATGASAAIPSGWVVDGEKVVTYVEAILQEKLPESVVIIGAGAIGMEFATIWSSYGVQVTIVEMLPNLLPLEDKEVSAELEKEYGKRKIKVLTSHQVQSLQAIDTGVQIIVFSEEGEKILVAEQALVAIGFHPNGRNLGLEELGVQLTERGAVKIDERMSTNLPGIWAVGDVTAKLMLAHVGSTQGIICAENIAGKETTPLNYEMMPRATYCRPQVASFGLTEAQAIERGYSVKIGRFPYQANGKALALGEAAGWVKLVTDGKFGEILGAHLVGPEVTELLPELTLAQMMELTPYEIARNVHAHPTLSEALMEAAHVAEDQAIHI